MRDNRVLIYSADTFHFATNCRLALRPTLSSIQQTKTVATLHYSSYNVNLMVHLHSRLRLRKHGAVPPVWYFTKHLHMIRMWRNFFISPNIRQNIFPKSSCKKWEVTLQPCTKWNTCYTDMWMIDEACVWHACCMANGKIWDFHTQYTSADDKYNFQYHRHHPSSIMHQIQGLQSKGQVHNTSPLNITTLR
jgi:hypothetical protein